jgi:hypothetical protein
MTALRNLAFILADTGRGIVCLALMIICLSLSSAIIAMSSLIHFLVRTSGHLIPKGATDVEAQAFLERLQKLLRPLGGLCESCERNKRLEDFRR